MSSGIDFTIFDKKALNYDWEKFTHDNDFRTSEAKAMLNDFINNKDINQESDFYTNEPDNDSEVIRETLEGFVKDNKRYSNSFRRYILYYHFLRNNQNLWYLRPALSISFNIRLILLEKSELLCYIATYKGIYESKNEQHFLPIYYEMDEGSDDIIGTYFQIEEMDFKALIDEITQPSIKTKVEQLDIEEQNNYHKIIRFFQYYYVNQKDSLLVVRLD